MFTVILLKLKKMVLENAASVILIVVLTLFTVFLLYQGYDKIKGVLGFDTVSTLKTKLEQEKTTNSVLIDANKSLEDSNTISTDVKDNTIEAITDLHDKENASKKDLIELMRKKDAEIEKLLLLQKAKESNNTKLAGVSSEPIKVVTTEVTKTSKSVITKVNKTPSGTAEPTTIEKKISAVQIDAIWTAYNTTISEVNHA